VTPVILGLMGLLDSADLPEGKETSDPVDSQAPVVIQVPPALMVYRDLLDCLVPDQWPTAS